MNETTKSINRPSTGKLIIIILVIIAITGVAVVSILRDRIVNNQYWTINIVGQGKVAAQPDTALINLGVQIDKATSADTALKQLNEKVDKVYKSLIDNKVPTEDIQTQNYSITPQYDYIDNVSKLAGYNANQTIIITVKNINQNKDRVANIVSAATTAGSNQVNNITFKHSDIENLKQQARLLAINDAKSKAKQMSDALGVELEKVVGWWENYVQPYDYASSYYHGEGGYGGGGSPTIPVSNQEIVIDINLNYKIK